MSPRRKFSNSAHTPFQNSVSATECLPKSKIIIQGSYFIWIKTYRILEFSSLPIQTKYCLFYPITVRIIVYSQYIIALVIGYIVASKIITFLRNYIANPTHFSYIKVKYDYLILLQGISYIPFKNKWYIFGF